MKFVLTYLIVLCSFGAIAQKALQKPYIWKNVKFSSKDYGYSYPEKNDKFTMDYDQFEADKKDKKESWTAYVSSAGISSKQGPGEENATYKELVFGSLYYVIDDKKEWIELSDAIQDGNSYGWVKKKDMVLWNNPLVDPITSIELKAFFINDYSRGKEEIIRNSEKYSLYDTPFGSDLSTDSRFIYEVLFIYKYEKAEGSNSAGRYLVSALYDLNYAASGSNPFMGWVSENRLELWPTSLCLEPNWNKEAVEERTAKGVQANILNTSEDINAFINDYVGEFIFKTPQREPAQMEFDIRMRKEIMRYPVLGGFMIGEDNCSFTTGASGKLNFGNSGLEEGMSEVAYFKWKDINEQLKINDRINVMFIVDGSEGMKPYLETLPRIIGAISEEAQMSGFNNQLQFGMTVHRNDFKKNPTFDDKVISHFDLSNDVQALLDWVENQKAFEYGDSEDREGVYYALNETVKRLPPNQTNIVIQLGNSPDVSSYRFSQEGEGLHIDLTEMTDYMNETGLTFHYAHFTTFTPSVNEQVRESLRDEMTREVLQNLISTYSRNYSGINWEELGANAESPKLKEEIGKDFDSFIMSDSHFDLREYYHHDHNLNDMQENIMGFIKSGIAKHEEFRETLAVLLKETSVLSDRAQDLNPATLAQIRSLDNSEDGSLFADLVKSKSHLFFKGKGVYRVNETEHPLFRYVLFVPENRLRNHGSQLDMIKSQLQKGDGTEAMDLMRRQFEKLAEDVLGGSKGDAYNLSWYELQEKLLGIDGVDIVRPFKAEMSFLGEITYKDLEKRRLKPELMKKYLELIEKNISKLDNILNNEFYYEVEGTGEKFYWVPVEFYFS